MCSCQKDEHSQILSGAPHSQITAWWDKAADIIPLNSGKGNAVAAVLRHYGFSKDEAIAFGDGHNDIEMLEAVRHGYCHGAMQRTKSRLRLILYANRLRMTEYIITVLKTN